MTKSLTELLTELESLARDVGEDEVWCLHPNGLSIWSGTEYDSDNVDQVMIARAGAMTDEASIKRMMFMAVLTPKVVLALTGLVRAQAAAFEKSDALVTEYQRLLDRATQALERLRP